MLRLLVLIHFIDLSLTIFVFNGSEHDNDFLDYPWRKDARRKDSDYTKEMDEEMAVFGILQNDQKKAKEIRDLSILNVSRVVHSRTDLHHPFMCTCACIAERIFMTAARCIRSLKVKYTTVIYQEVHQLHAQAFVIPAKHSKQFHNDIGFIIVSTGQFSGAWKINSLEIKTEDFDRSSDKHPKYTYFGIHGFARNTETSEGTEMSYAPYYVNKLALSKEFCFKLYGANTIKSYKVPCLWIWTCNIRTIDDNPTKDYSKCQIYLGSEGGLVYAYNKNKKWEYNVGVATWGVQTDEPFVLPVGIAWVGTNKFKKCHECALKIAKSGGEGTQNSYQHLCTNAKVYI